jgi:hypothetical protein
MSPSNIRRGRPIATEFLTLPDRVRHTSVLIICLRAQNTPGYYELVKLPIAIDIIEVRAPAAHSALTMAG